MKQKIHLILLKIFKQKIQEISKEGKVGFLIELLDHHQTVKKH
jgi:hypothetical protein